MIRSILFGGVDDMTENCRHIKDELKQAKADLKEARDTLNRIEAWARPGHAATISEMSADDVPQRKYEFLLGCSVVFSEILRQLSIKRSAPKISGRGKLLSGFWKVP